jgi:hypothetical protein
MKSNKLLVYPDNLMSANEFAHIIKECSLEAVVIVASAKIKQTFIDLQNVEFLHLYNVSDKVVQKNKGGVKNVLRNVPKFFLTPVKAYSFYRRYLYLKKLIGTSYDTAIIATDRSYADGFVMPFYFFCKRHGIRMVIPSTADFADKERMLKARLEKESQFKSTWFEKLFFRNYVENYGGVELIYYSIDIILTFKLFGVLSKNPWVMGGNNSALLCLNNKNLEQQYISEGVHKENITVTGSYKIVDDFISESKSIEVLGFALPQMFEHDILPWGEHISIIEELLAGLMLLEKEIIVFLHPKMDKIKYSYLESRYNCKISTNRTDLGIKDVDLYIATFSTTVLTATIFGIPSLVIDCFNARFKMFNHLPSISIFDEIPSLLLTAEKLILNENKYSELKSSALLDSKSLEENPGHGMNNLKNILQNEI